MQIDKKEILTGIAKSVFSAIPYAGTPLTELVFDYNGRIKQNRLNNFIDVLSEGFLNQTDINIDNIKTEHFNDVFEAVVKRVFTTKSEAKLRRFRDILLAELRNPTVESEFVNVYLDLITDLSEEEIIILFYHTNFNKTYYDELQHSNELRDKIQQKIEQKKRETIVIGGSKLAIQINELEKERNEIRRKHELLDKFRTAEFYNIQNDKFMFFKQRLYSRGLLIDHGINRIGMDPFIMMGITEFGIHFISFIKAQD